MRVLILGAQGQLGRALSTAFLADTVLAWDQAELDITDTSAVPARIAAAAPAVVVNAAAYTDVEGAEEAPAVAEAVNGQAVGLLARACRARDIPLLHVSTDYVFRGDQEEGYSEDAIPESPQSQYGISKLLGERLLQKFTEKFWLVRTSWLFGPNGKNFVDTMLRLGAERAAVRVVADQHGCPTYTRDLAEAIAALVHERAPFGVYHLTNSGVTTWAEFAAAVFALAGLSARVTPISSAEFPTKARRPHWSILRNTKRQSLRPWYDALREYMLLHVPPHAHH